MVKFEQIKALTDQQINVRVTAAVHDLHESYHESGSDKSKIYQWYSSDELREFKVHDYCNDPAAMMPIVFDTGISLIFCHKQRVWIAYDDSVKPKYAYYDKNPCRAAAAVYLKTTGYL